MKTLIAQFQKYTAHTGNHVGKLLALMTAALLTASCATTKTSTGKAEVDPFKVPKATVLQTVKTIAIFPPTTAPTLQNSNIVGARFGSLMVAKLREGGFSAVEPSQVMLIVIKQRAQVGGFYDPVTGRVDKTKHRTYSDNVLQELKAKFKIDAVLYPDIEARSVEYSRKSAANPRVGWDGTSESIFVSSGTRADRTVGGRGDSHSGSVIGVSLRVTLKDMQGRDLYVKRGGIQLAMKLESPYGSQLHPVPPSELFADPQRNQNAVNLALDYLVR